MIAPDPPSDDKAPADLAQSAGTAKPAPPSGLRPAALNPLFAPVATLPGVGPATATTLARLLGRPEPRCLDLLAHLPCDAVDPRPRAWLTAADEGKMVTLRAEIESHRAAPPGGRQPHRVLATAAGEPLELAFFRPPRGMLEEKLAPGATALLHGRIGRYGERWQMVHPELLDPDTPADGFLPLYPLVQGLTQNKLRALLRQALQALPDLPEWLPRDLLRAEGWPGWAEALRAAHHPADAEALAPTHPARQRLAFDELLAGQLALDLGRGRRERSPGRSLAGTGELVRQLLATLPFPLTASQEGANAEIGRDLAAVQPMLRLLQGDVGSGKTVVALCAMLQAVEAGTQAALMAPTEVLALQHAATLQRLLAPLGLELGLLTGREPAARRRAVLSGLAAGSLPLAVGTHALFQAEVAFFDLGLAVIDEQHRFGVGQRFSLVGKGSAVDLLLTTATPIPRSLVLALYGDIATSRLTEKPPGRRPITTRAVPNERLDEVLDAIGRALARGERIYWICPAVEESEQGAVMAAVERHRQLAERFGAAIGLVHGRLGREAKEAAIQAFATGATALLVATTVVEVGVDVPDATIIVIEHAERFGLAQLHQLRGRVGRGERPSACLLLYEPPLGPVAHDRLATVRATEDGFAIAEADLRLRGPGEVLGRRQSGLPEMRFADLERHGALLERAREVARSLRAGAGTPPAGAAGQPDANAGLRLLLHLFERPDALALLAAG